MIGINSIDRHTTTVEDAAAFERLRGGSYADDDRPALSDLLHDPRSIPTPMERAAAVLSLSLAHCGTFRVSIDIVREGVLSVRGADAEIVASIYGDTAEVIERDGVVWVRIIHTAFADPFMVDGVAHSDPPF